MIKKRYIFIPLFVLTIGVVVVGAYGLRHQRVDAVRPDHDLLSVQVERVDC